VHDRGKSRIEAAAEAGEPAAARLERTASFVAQLHRLSAKSPQSWRRAERVGRDISLADARLDQAISDAEEAGLIERRADDEGLVLLTAAGRAAASQP
jgi:DNA-binding MarR family transcriptional regulator